MNISDTQHAVKMLKRARRRHILWSFTHTCGIILLTQISIAVLMWIGIISLCCFLLSGNWWW